MSTKDCVQDLCHQEQSNELLLTSEYVLVLFLLVHLCNIFVV